MENKIIVFKVIVGVDGQKRRTTSDNFKDQAQAFFDEYKIQKDAVRDAIANLSHEYVLYRKGYNNWDKAQKALENAQKAAAEMNKFLGLDFRQFKTTWKPYQVDKSYELICKAIGHYWPKFYGTPEVDGILQYVTFYTDELKKIRYVERDED